MRIVIGARQRRLRGSLLPKATPTRGMSDNEPTKSVVVDLEPKPEEEAGKEKKKIGRSNVCPHIPAHHTRLCDMPNLLSDRLPPLAIGSRSRAAKEAARRPPQVMTPHPPSAPPRRIPSLPPVAPAPQALLTLTMT